MDIALSVKTYCKCSKTFSRYCRLSWAEEHSLRWVLFLTHACSSRDKLLFEYYEYTFHGTSVSCLPVR